MEIKVLDHGYVKHIESWGGGEYSQEMIKFVDRKMKNG